MFLLVTYKQLVNFGTVVSIIAGIILIIAAVMSEEACAKKYGMPTWKEWWEDIKKR